MIKNYDAFYVENNPNLTIPDCYGAIGITFDDKLNGFNHSLLHIFNQMSTER